MHFYQIALGFFVSQVESRISPSRLARATQSSYWPGFDNLTTLFVLGDSYSKTGFTPSGSQPSISNPLGNPEYPGRTSANGPNWVDFLTVQYNESLLFTYDLAVGGSTVDNTVVDNGYDVVSQINDKFVPFYGNGTVWSPDSTLFAIWIGINDVSNSYLLQNSSDIQALMFERYASLIEDLYSFDARNFLFINVPPMERAPRVTQSSQASTRIPLSKNATGLWNQGVKQLAQDFEKGHSDTKVFQFDAHSLFNEVIDHPEKFDQTKDYQNTTTYCEAYKSGTPELDTKWDNCTYAVDEYLWLNSLHPTYPIHELLAQKVAVLLGA